MHFSQSKNARLLNSFHVDILSYHIINVFRPLYPTPHNSVLVVAAVKFVIFCMSFVKYTHFSLKWTSNNQCSSAFLLSRLIWTNFDEPAFDRESLQLMPFC